jgi:phosphoserine phosphatase
MTKQTDAPTRILVTVSGHDSQGITAQLTGILANRNTRILDIAQAVIQNLLSLSILFEVPSSVSEDGSKQITADLKKCASELKLNLECKVLNAEDFEKTSTSKETLSHYAVTLIADSVSAEAVHEVAAALAKRKFNIDTVKRLSEGSFGCVEMIVSALPENAQPLKMKKELLSIAKKQGVDIALQAEGLYRRAKRLVVFDMDSTLIQSEVIDELARHKGVYDEVAAITHSAMSGKMDFDESLRQRVSKLKGMTQNDLLQVFEKIELTPGTEDLLRVLKKLGYKLGLISGGFMFVAERLKAKLGIDYVYANSLESKNGLLTGNVIPPIVNAQRKADLLDVIAQQEQIELDQVIAVGDGANDILMLEKAGLGIAFNAKPKVREKADLAISQKNLRTVLYLLGLAEKDLSVCFKTDSLR